MVIEKGVLKTEAIFSDNKEHRYVLRKEWDSKKKTATIIMLNAGFADSLKSDCTTLYIINNLSKLDFGSVNIVNIFSKIMIKLKTKENLKTFTDDENINQILKVSEKSDSIIIAWGRLNNKKVTDFQDKLLEKLKPYRNKLYQIASESGEAGYHPICPQVKNNWILKEFESQLKEEKSDKDIVDEILKKNIAKENI